VRRRRISEDRERREAGISPHQAAAAAAPHRSIRELAGQPRSGPEKDVGSRGNFQDFDILFEQLTKPPVMELGNPLPSEKYLPKPQVGSCPAAHNRALLGEEHPD